MCRKHYMAWHRATPKQARSAAPGFSRLSVAERFQSKVQRGAQDECWLWTGSQHGFGHGQFFVSKERGLAQAHAFALELATGEPCPPGRETCHRCDNPPCCNPVHLYYGTRQQNVDDMWSRDRGRRGSRTTMAKLTESQVLAIRIRYADGETSTSLASEYGVRSTTITYITTGRNWKHVGGPISVGSPGRRPRREAA
ncbi:HNH endonuclease [Streptomyces sp. NPDC088348]|uniref:HNH endonuclease n=1 Tax=Streptomyces sp. NPDC088348 TaxID=3365853 RepID=UPI003823107D